VEALAFLSRAQSQKRRFSLLHATYSLGRRHAGADEDAHQGHFPQDVVNRQAQLQLAQTVMDQRSNRHTMMMRHRS
jgi:hypothetical protein